MKYGGKNNEKNTDKLQDDDKVLEFINDCENELRQLKTDPIAKYWFRQGINRVKEFIQLDIQLETLEQELHTVVNKNKEQKEI